MSTLKRLVSKLAPDDAKAAARVALADDDASAYVAKHAKQLAERGITKPVPRLPFVALLDALEAGKRVALIDHRAAPADVVRALGTLKAPKATAGWAQHIVKNDDLDVETVLAAAAAAWEPKGIVLVNLDTTSDQLAIAAVPRDALAGIQEAAKQAKLRIAVVEAAAPPAEAPAAAESPARAMETWPDATQDPPGTWRYFLLLEQKRSLCLVKYPVAYDVHASTLRGDSKPEKKAFASAAACTAAYLAHLAQLRADGWQQFDADEHAKALRAARKR